MRHNIIAAISTPPGKGGVAIIRVSGEGTTELVSKIFRPKSKKQITDYPRRTQIYGDIICRGEQTDDGLLTLFPAPNSYTGEDMAEISCHGGVLVTKLILEELISLGALPALPGEFTERAFVSGKLSLSEAEAIGTLLDAESEEQIRLASRTSRGHLSAKIDSVSTRIRDLLASVYARIDYPEEDLGELTDGEVLQSLRSIREEISLLSDTYRTGRAINEGIRVTVCGRPNVGKSTLYNAILGEEAAIVTDIAGTTRDILERRTALGRVAVTLTDTAGIHDSDDAVERIGVGRAKERILSSELILAVFDATVPLTGEDAEIIELLGDAPGVKLCLLNKKDAPSFYSASELSIPDGVFEDILYMSPKECGEDILRRLCEYTSRLFTDEKITPLTDPIVATARQHGALRSAIDSIDSAIRAYEMGLPADAASSDIELALGAISELDGRGVSESVVDSIFSHFCVGK